MVTILFSVGLRCSLPPVLFLLLCAQQGEAQKLKALTQTSRQSVFMIDLPTKSFFKTCKEYSLCVVCARARERVCACACLFVCDCVQDRAVFLLGSACARRWVLESIHCQLSKHNKSKQVFQYVECCNMKARRLPGNSFPPLPLNQKTEDWDEVKMSKTKP